MRAGTQVPYYDHLMLAKVLKMEEVKKRMIKPFVGGGFGCRTESLNITFMEALAARAARVECSDSCIQRRNF